MAEVGDARVDAELRLDVGRSLVTRAGRMVFPRPAAQASLAATSILRITTRLSH